MDFQIGTRLDISKVFDLNQIGDMQLTFRKRLRHTVVFMDCEACVLVDETGLPPKRIGQRPHPCQHCEYILEGYGAELCHKSDKEAAEIAGVLRKPLLYRCWALKSNMAIPITVGDLDVIGNLYAGQFFAVLDSEEEKPIAESICKEKGLLVHDGRDIEGNTTNWIQPGFFWTRNEIEMHTQRQQEVHEKAKVEVPITKLQSSWQAVPQIHYEQALDSVDLLRSVANTFATEAYEKFAYRLNHGIRDAADKYLRLSPDSQEKRNRWVSEADEMIYKMLAKKGGVALLTDQLTELYVEVLNQLLTLGLEDTSEVLDRKKWIAELSGEAEEYGQISADLELIRRKIDALKL